MGLDDLTDDKKKEVQSVDEEEVEEFIDRFNQLEEVVVRLTDEVNGLKREVTSLKKRVRTMESNGDGGDETNTDYWER